MTANLQVKRKDGAAMPVTMSVPAVHGGIATAAGVFRISTEVAGRHPLAPGGPAALADYRQLLDRAPFGVCQVDDSGAFLYANRPLAGMLGYPSVQALLLLNARTQLFRDFHAGERFFQRVSGGGGEIEAEWNKCDGIPIRVRLTSHAISSPGSGARIHEVYVEDLDRRRFREAQIRQAETMQALGRLASKVAHDFNNVLGVVMGYTQLLHERLEPHDILHSSLEQIVNTMDQAASLTRQLLGFSRKLALEPRVFSLDARLHELDRHLEELLGPGIELAVRRNNNPGRIWADPGAIDQIILNLAVHAREAMPHGGRLAIEIAGVCIAGAQGTLSPGAYVRLTLSDTGPAIGPQELAHVFEPFFSSASRPNPDGLGLATVYEIVRQSGGYIWARSQPGEGAQFIVHFPRAQKQAEIPMTVAGRSGSAHRRKPVPAGRK